VPGLQGSDRIEGLSRSGQSASLYGMQLDPKARMELMKFVCSFVWTDLTVAQAERDLIQRMSGRLGLTADEIRQVQAWLRTPPAADEVDPTAIPREHKEMFLRAAELAIRADGHVVGAERESYALFRDLLK
jgi:hypothetical protein